MSMALDLLAYACNFPVTDGHDVCDQGPSMGSEQAGGKNVPRWRSHAHNRF